MDYRDFIAQLETYKNVIADLLGNVSQEHAAYRPTRDRWTILEIINHLVDIEKEDFRIEFRIVLYEPETPWPSFSIDRWRVERNYNGRNLRESVTEFVTERNKSLEWLKTLSDPDLYATHASKKFKGESMKAGDIVSAWVGHDLFHIRQITLAKWYLLQEFSKPFSPAYSGFKIM